MLTVMASATGVIQAFICACVFLFWFLGNRRPKQRLRPAYGGEIDFGSKRQLGAGDWGIS